MANMLRTVGAAGDHPTVAAAIAYVTANFTYAGSDIATIRIIDAAEFNESGLTITTSIPGTASATSYVVLEAADGVKHDGTYNTSKARIRGSTNTEHILSIDENYVHVRNLAFKQDSTGSSDECIRILSTRTNTVIEKCVFETANVGSQDAIYSGQVSSGPTTVFDCVIKCGGSTARAGINAQIFNASTNTQTWHVEHCTIDCNGAGDANGSGISCETVGVGDTVNMNVYNTAVFDATGDCFDNQAETGTITWAGQGNMGSDTSCQTKLSTTNNLDSQTLSVTDEAATEFLVTSLTAGSEDYQLIEGVSATNNAVGGAISGGTRDSRLDITVDIAGNRRPAAYTSRDIGAFQTLRGDVYINDATTLDGGEVLQTYPGIGNYADGLITMTTAPDITGLTGQLYCLVKTATGALAYRAVTVGGVTITDVDTDEAWTDGDTGLVITGTGFV